MIRVAMAYVPSRAAAEEAVQETWIAVMRGIDGFEGRSSLKTWVFRILVNVAMRTGARERRSMPFSALAAAEDTGEPSVDPDRFLPADHELFPGHWAIMPARWPTPEEGLLAGEIRGVVAGAIAELPEAQRTVIGLRDVEGWSSEEVCEALEISAGNQRILLHRARSRVRNAIEDYLGAVEEIDFDAVTAELMRTLLRRTPTDDRHPRRDDLACTEEVEIMTDYLEGALPADDARRSSATCRRAPAAPNTSRRCGPSPARSRPHGGLDPGRDARPSDRRLPGLPQDLSRDSVTPGAPAVTAKSGTGDSGRRR